MSISFDDLSPNQIKEIHEYLNFELHRRREIRGEVSGEMKDLLEEKINTSQVYAGTEAVELLENSLPKTISRILDVELAHQRNINSNLISKILHEAQEIDLFLQLNVPELNNEELTDAANLLSAKIMLEGESVIKRAALGGSVNVKNKEPAVVEKKVEEKKEAEQEIDYEAINLENERLRAKLTKNKREWEEFIEAQKKLKDLNVEFHKLKEQLGEA